MALEETITMEFTQAQLGQLRAVIKEAMQEQMERIEANLSCRLTEPARMAGRIPQSRLKGQSADEPAMDGRDQCARPDDALCAGTPAENGAMTSSTALRRNPSLFSKGPWVRETQDNVPQSREHIYLREHCRPGSDELKVDKTKGLAPGDTILILGVRQKGLARRTESRLIKQIQGLTLILDQGVLEGFDVGSRITKESNANHSFRERIRSLVHTQGFDILIGCVIVINSAMIGWSTQLNLNASAGGNAPPKYLFYLESLFLAVFLFELILRLFADGSQNFNSGWFWFDTTLVLTGVASTWIIEPITEATDSENLPVISQLLTVRILRLIRLVRAMRLLEQFKELWKLCSGLMKAARTMLSVCLLVLLAIFTFACLGVEVITGSKVLDANPQTQAIVREHFSSLPEAMLTLMQFANADSIAGIYFPICKEEPLLVLYFLLLWLVVTVALMNLVTAIIVENAMAKTREDAEEQQTHTRKVLKKVYPQLKQLFQKLDKDRSGTITVGEIGQLHLSGALQLPTEIEACVQPDRLLDVFEFMDADQSGCIDEDEFVEGIVSLALSSVPIETTQILHLLRHTHSIILDMNNDMNAIGITTHESLSRRTNR